MFKKHSLARKTFSPASLYGQGIAAAPKAYFAKQSMERVRRGTAKSPVYTLSAKGSQRINALVKLIVIGSQVSTCNDVGAQNNSTVIAPVASMPMPVIINPKNTEEWKREQEESEKKEPKFSSVKWGTSSVEEGKEVELTASVQDIEDGNMVTLQVFPEGKGPEDGVPIASFPLTVKGGSVSAKWSYHANKSELPPDSDPKFVFSAHCAWCNFEKSSNSVEVKLIRPEIKKAEWQDKERKLPSY